MTRAPNSTQPGSKPQVRQSLLRRAYADYARGRSSPLLRLHRLYFSSRWTTRFHFGMEVEEDARGTYHHLTTLLMKWLLEKRLRAAPQLRTLEVGTGNYAVLSGYLSRIANDPIDGIELDAKRFENSKRHIARNGVSVNVFHSDLFAAVPDRVYDLIFWNLPYYDDPEDYLRRFFEEVPEHLSDSGEILIGYNTRPLPRETVLEIMERSGRLRLVEPVTWWWNLHDVLVIGKRP